MKACVGTWEGQEKMGVAGDEACTQGLRRLKSKKSAVYKQEETLKNQRKKNGF